MTDDQRRSDADETSVEAYCVRDRTTVEMLHPTPVWTRQGVPATRGECPICGGVVFRMGNTPAHAEIARPAAIKVATNTRVKLPQETVYLNFAPDDVAIAEQLADDLQKLGVACWLHENDPEDFNWAGGVHPALRECLRMVLLLSPAALTDERVEAAWTFFKTKSKTVHIARISPADPPDDLRRRPRYDFAADYKTAFRQLLQALDG
ncbi:MAG: toll/interleukin-1 receptor domain-containing protein [Chloroflexi bacterium]|nr:toll/interleukin-1 receptor domain-containing protein [Chloroflexota bacterium]